MCCAELDTTTLDKLGKCVCFDISRDVVWFYSVQCNWFVLIICPRTLNKINQHINWIILDDFEVWKSSIVVRLSWREVVLWLSIAHILQLAEQLTVHSQCLFFIATNWAAQSSQSVLVFHKNVRRNYNLNSLWGSEQIKTKAEKLITLKQN